jgi:hypothetical protein
VKVCFWFNDPGIGSAEVDQSDRDGVVQLAGLPTTKDSVSVYIFDGSEYIETLWAVRARTWNISNPEQFDVEIELEPAHSKSAQILNEYKNAKFG